MSTAPAFLKRKRTDIATPTSIFLEKIKEEGEVEEMPPPDVKKRKIWSGMTTGNKASAIKTFVQRHGQDTLANSLLCMTKQAKQAVQKLESMVDTLSNNMDLIAFGMENDKTMRSNYSSAMGTMRNTVDKLSTEVIPSIVQFVTQDVRVMDEIREEVEGFISEVVAQCDDIIYAYPDPPPESALNLSMFPAYQTSRSHGRRKSSNANRVPPARRGRRPAVAGDATDKTSRIGGGGSDRRRRSIGMRPTMDAFCQNLDSLIH